MIDGEPVAPGTTVYIPPRGIVTRRSTDIAAIHDARAARALRYIWDHYAESIGPEEAASACRIGRRSLDRQFKKRDPTAPSSVTLKGKASSWGIRFGFLCGKHDQSPLHKVLQVVHHKRTCFEEREQILYAKRLDQVFDRPLPVK